MAENRYASAPVEYTLYGQKPIEIAMPVQALDLSAKFYSRFKPDNVNVALEAAEDVMGFNSKIEGLIKANGEIINRKVKIKTKSELHDITLYGIVKEVRRLNNLKELPYASILCDVEEYCFDGLSGRMENKKRLEFCLDTVKDIEVIG